ncbi:hypothetical protein D3C80_1882010 [compost metagenome]
MAGQRPGEEQGGCSGRPGDLPRDLAQAVQRGELWQVGAQSINPEALRAPCRSGLVSRWAAKQPQDYCLDAEIAGAALRPYRDTRPLLHAGYQLVDAGDLLVPDHFVMA